MAGLVRPFLEAANRVTTVAVVAHGRRLAHMRFAPEESPYRFIAMVPQDVTERLLVAELRRRGGDVEYNTTFRSAEEHEDGVSCDAGRKGDPITLQAAFVVGCDGAHSTVRHLLNIGVRGSGLRRLVHAGRHQTNDSASRRRASAVSERVRARRHLPDECHPAARRGDHRSARGRRPLTGAGAEDTRATRTERDRGAGAALEQLFPHPSPARSAAQSRTPLHRRRRRSHSQPLRRAGDEYWFARRVESGLEARPVSPGTG